MSEKLHINREVFDSATTGISRARADLDNAQETADDVAGDVGHSRLSHELKQFAANWRITRGKLSTSMAGLEKNLRTIATTFRDTDTGIADQLPGDQGNSGGGSGRAPSPQTPGGGTGGAGGTDQQPLPSPLPRTPIAPAPVPFVPAEPIVPGSGDGYAPRAPIAPVPGAPGPLLPGDVSPVLPTEPGPGGPGPDLQPVEGSLDPGLTPTPSPDAGGSGGTGGTGEPSGDAGSPAGDLSALPTDGGVGPIDGGGGAAGGGAGGSDVGGGSAGLGDVPPPIDETISAGDAGDGSSSTDLASATDGTDAEAAAADADADDEGGSKLNPAIPLGGGAAALAGIAAGSILGGRKKDEDIALSDSERVQQARSALEDLRRTRRDTEERA